MTWLISSMRRLAVACTFAFAPALAAPAMAQQVDWGQQFAQAALSDGLGQPVSGADRAWQYQQAFYLYGMKLVYDRTGDERLRAHLEEWGRQHVEPDGRIVTSPGGSPVVLGTLDSLMPGRVVLILWQWTGDDRYRIAAETIRQRLRDWPTTRSGAFWHRDDPTKPFAANVIWADGSFMFAPFLAEYSRLFPSDANTGLDEAADQLEIYGSHLQDDLTGLLWHAYDQDRYYPWAKLPNPQHAPVMWCRAVGWYGLSLVSVLDALPAGHPRRAALLGRLSLLMKGYRRFLAPEAGGWRQVMDAPAIVEGPNGPLDNFVETSCSAMHAYVVTRAVERGWLSLAQHRAAALAIQGILERAMMVGARASLIGGVRGTGLAATQADYLNPASVTTDDPHGLGAFLLMYESALAQFPVASTRLSREAESGSVTAPLARLVDPAASNGQVVAVPLDVPTLSGVDPVGRSRITVQLAKAGKYRLWGRFQAPTSASNFFRVRIDNKAWWTWEVQPNANGPRWDSLRIGPGYATPLVFSLSAGVHLIELAYGEPGSAADQLLLTTARIYAPVGIAE